MTDRSGNPESSYPIPASGEWFVSEAQPNPVREKSFEFALQIVGVCRSLQGDREYVISKQLMRSGTSIGANIEEAVAAESRKDFLHKMNLALKEARESHYWLRLLDASDLVPNLEVAGYLQRADELVSLLTAITRSVKNSKQE